MKKLQKSSNLESKIVKLEEIKKTKKRVLMLVALILEGKYPKN